MGRLFYKGGTKSRLWGDNFQSTLGEINLRSEFKNLLFGTPTTPQRGHWVIYRRFDLTQTASGFYDEVYHEGVGGPAHPYTDTVVMTRSDPMFNAEKDEASTPIGILEGGVFIYYFEYDLVPSIDDQIFEIDWEDHTRKPRIEQLPTFCPTQPGKYRDKFNIKAVHPYRCDGGQISYWIVYVNKDRISY